MRTVLLVDDEKRMLDLLELYITPHGYKCVKKQSGKDATEFIENERADLVILDIMMPDLDGWQTCAKIRETSDIPIIMLTARDDKEEVVKGLKIGADDYITKPFNEKELLARMEAVMRRTKNDKEDILKFKGLVLNEEAYEFTFEKQSISLTPKEYSLLALFISNPNKVFTRDHLLTTIWNYNSDVEDRTIDSHIRNVREKLRHVGFPVDEHLKTVWGVGYKWSTEGEQ
ncbi:response regulator transcription factor [Neobacillus sedimentimangrovi]|uniref:Response regulator transcription factor n=1 Tax=Neobacillus sedimentimangrovi TaxID=2699460 RepID=A0ABS8QM48_9BACI|nr:response regulator transcription factor [Neobacillus sedimentimangrovi]MCD4840322.1 response regulator transcription factor [Neobacillus sedimentimangrovi]